MKVCIRLQLHSATPGVSNQAIMILCARITTNVKTDSTKSPATNNKATPKSPNYFLAREVGLEKAQS